MKLTRRSLVAAAGATLLGGAARADGDACAPDRLDAILGEIARARAAVRTLRGPFTQERTIGLLAAKVRSTGTLTLVRPDRLRWELALPDDVVYWVLPEGLAYKSRSGQGRMQSGSAKFALALDDLRIVLAGDLSLLRARYDLVAHCPDGGPTVFEATPRAGVAAVPMQRLVFTLAADRVSPMRATIVEGARDKTEITFGELEKNGAVDPATVRPNF